MSVEGSPIANIFMGMFKSSLQCDVCKHTSLTFDPYWDIGLPIAKVCAYVPMCHLQARAMSGFNNLPLMLLTLVEFFF